MNESPDLFIDKDCLVCASFGDKVLDNSNNINIRYTDELSPNLEALDSIILRTNSDTYIGMDALVQVVGSWKGCYKFIHITKIFPKYLNTFIYRLIASNRYKLSKFFSKRKN